MAVVALGQANIPWSVLLRSLKQRVGLTRTRQRSSTWRCTRWIMFEVTRIVRSSCPMSRWRSSSSKCEQHKIGARDAEAINILWRDARKQNALDQSDDKK